VLANFLIIFNNSSDVKMTSLLNRKKLAGNSPNRVKEKAWEILSDIVNDLVFPLRYRRTHDSAFLTEYPLPHLKKTHNIF